MQQYGTCWRKPFVAIIRPVKQAGYGHTYIQQAAVVDKALLRCNVCVACMLSINSRTRGAASFVPTASSCIHSYAYKLMRLGVAEATVSDCMHWHNLQGLTDLAAWTPISKFPLLLLNPFSSVNPHVNPTVVSTFNGVTNDGSPSCTSFRVSRSWPMFLGSFAVCLKLPTHIYDTEPFQMPPFSSLHAHHAGHTE